VLEPHFSGRPASAPSGIPSGTPLELNSVQPDSPATGALDILNVRAVARQAATSSEPIHGNAHRALWTTCATAFRQAGHAKVVGCITSLTIGGCEIAGHRHDCQC
jgi:hypothetical protein